MADAELPDDLRDETGAVWRRYLDRTAALRPALHGYCLQLTRDLFDAEDLLQDTLLRGFATLASVHQTIQSPRSYLARIATNLWIDTVRRRGIEARALSAHAHDQETRGATSTVAPDRGASLRDAGEVLLGRLSPQERAAVLLKDGFDMSLKEIAEVLGTSVGAVKAALHGGRVRLRDIDEPAPPDRPAPPRALVDRFVERLNASDLPGLLDLMLDSATVHTLGGLLEVGREQFERKHSWLWQSVHVHPDLPADVRPEKWQNELSELDGEPVMLSFASAPGGDGRVLQSVTRFDVTEERIARIRAYYLCPETLHELGRRLGLAVGTVPYRVPTREEWMRVAAREGGALTEKEDSR